MHEHYARLKYYENMWEHTLRNIKLTVLAFNVISTVSVQPCGFVVMCNVQTMDTKNHSYDSGILYHDRFMRKIQFYIFIKTKKQLTL
jgi:hypothetical protein